MNGYENAKEATDYITGQLQLKGYKKTTTAIVIGSGASKILDSFELIASIPYRSIPNLSGTTFHKGELIWAKTPENTSVLILNGRLHYYEGYDLRAVTFPIRILKLLGVDTLFMTNASGGLNPAYQAGELVLIRDHINLMPEHPLRGPNDDRWGLRFPDMSDAYNADLRALIKNTYHSINATRIKEGIYVGFQGPSLETPAEYNYLHIIGGDMVGMSTVPEVIVANHCGIRTAVISIVTNICYPPESITATTLDEVIEMADSVAPQIGALLLACLKTMNR